MLNYAKNWIILALRLAKCGAILPYVILYLNKLCWTGVSRDSGGKAFVIDTLTAYTAHWKADISRGKELRMLLIRRVRKVSTHVSSYLSDLKLTDCARRYLKKILAYIGFRLRHPSIDGQRTPLYVCGSQSCVCLDGTHRKVVLR